MTIPVQEVHRKSQAAGVYVAKASAASLFSHSSFSLRALSTNAIELRETHSC